ncbi:MAG: hypothetical protein IIZ39_12170, partial [Blautia sp.]|nr:hypothetical protein [Blautia sp.]
LFYVLAKKGHDGSGTEERKSEISKAEEGQAEENEMEDGKAFPFGPFIAASVAFMLLFGQPLVSWYLGLLGLT